jgi:hypothetical protein
MSKHAVAWLKCFHIFSRRKFGMESSTEGDVALQEREENLMAVFPKKYGVVSVKQRGK